MRCRCLVALACLLTPGLALAEPPRPSTFSIVAVDPEAGEAGVAVASRFFAVGSVVPWAAADAGAVATQSFANTSYGPRGLDLLRAGLSPQEAVEVLTRSDDGRAQRQLGIVAADGRSATYSGPGCNAWAGGRNGVGYAVQGNILTGEDVVVEMERAFLASKGQPLARRLLAALLAGDAAGGDSRGRQSAALLVVRTGAGYGGRNDRAIDVRVDDHEDPLGEIARLTTLGLVNDRWNRGWTAYSDKRPQEALRWQEETATLAEDVPAMLPEVLYDLAVIRLAAGKTEPSLEALRRAVKLNPRLAVQARGDEAMAAVRDRLDAALGK